MFEGNFLMSRIVSKHMVSGLCSGVLLAMSVPASASVDAKLLDMLSANGSITHDQRMELQAELEKEQKEQEDKKTASAKFEDKLAWATKTQFKGDIRLREETVSTEGGTGGTATKDANDQDRQRIRMRLGAYSQINPEVDAGIRIASGSSDDRRSTNQSMENYFSKKSLWMDQAYIDWHPDAAKGLHLIGGKMPYAWTNVADVIWDGDINPEGLVATYKHALIGNSEWFGSAGYFNMKDNVDGEGVEFKHDAQMYTGQLGVIFSPADKVKATLGGSVYSFDNDNTVLAQQALAVNGNSTTKFQLWEGFGQLDFNNLPLPVSIYGQYVVNSEASTDGDTAWLFGLKTAYNAFKFDYNYRDVQRNAVVGAFTDSDFANGFTGSRGHKFKLGYDISKNFTASATYYMTQTDAYQKAKGFGLDTDVNTLQLDLEAKF